MKRRQVIYRSAGWKRLVSHNLLAIVAAAVVAGSVGIQARAAEELEITGPAYIVADEAYKALARGDYETAAAKAREAIRQRPDLARLKRLLVEALAGAGRLDEAERTAGDFIGAGETDPELSGQRTRLRRQLARRPGELAYRALERKDLGDAIAKAREAVAYAPDVAAYRLLLITTLLADHKLEDARNAASDALAQDDEDVVPLVLRGYVSQRLGDRNAAIADFDKALSQDWLSGEDQRSIRLIVADAALAAGDGQAALSALKDLKGTDAEASARLRVARSLAQGRTSAPSSRRDIPEPFLDCRVTPYGQECALRPGRVADESVGYASAAYRAFARRDYAEAVKQAREAVQVDPANPAFSALLVNALAAAKKPAEAEKAATVALAKHGPSRELLAQRGYARLQLGRPKDAVTDFEAALRLGASTDSRTLRLSLADAALAAKQPQRALDALSRINERTYAVSSRKAFASLALGRKEDALAAVKAARVQASNAAERGLMTRTEIGLLVDLGHQREAEALFADARSRGELVGSDLDIAYLAIRVKDDVVADESFERAEMHGRLTGTSPIDAAYVAKRLVKNDRAKALLRKAIDAESSGALKLEPQYLFGLRREMAELERTWGFYSSLSYGAVGVMPGAPFAAPLSGGNVLQTGDEIYWRPPVIGYRNGATVDLFARAFQTLQDETGGPTGMSTTQGAVGVRWKPFGSTNLVLEISRLFPIGENARYDTLLRMAYSDGRGTDLRVDVPDWWTWQVYADVGHYIQNAQTIATSEVRVGRSYRLDGISNRLVATPFLSAGASYDNLLATPNAVGAGAGLNLRYWFREDKYTAPMSYVDVNVQYRFKLAGDDRAQGIFAGITVAY